MNILQAIILGTVEGITEFLPISSTGHLMLTAKLLSIVQTEFAKSFEITIQLGAILAVIVLYAKTLVVQRKALTKILAAFIPTAVVGFVLYKIIKKLFLQNIGIVLVALFLGGLFLIVFERFYREKKDAVDDFDNISYKDAVIIGLFQSLAVVPGVSRAAATIIGGLLLGIKRKTIVEFSFLLAVPTMLAATGYDLFKNAPSFSSDQFGALAVGFVISFLVAIAAIKFLLHYIKNHNFTSFGIYRILVAAVFWMLYR